MQTSVSAPAGKGSFAPIRPGSLVGTVRGQVREAILCGEIPAGEALRDSVLATQMAVSRAPVREALRLLEQSGLIEKTANKPYRVKSFEREDVAELAVLRIALETTAARLIVARRADISAAREALAEMQMAWDSGAMHELNAIDMKFHRALIFASGVSRLQEKYDDLVDQMVLAWLRLERHVERKADSLAVHQHILDTLQGCMGSGDAAPIQQVLIDHIRTGMGCPDLVI
jgi:DNA-binding GntR family transcriptional regulator